MITAIEIENFKAIGKRVPVELKPLTLLFGPNSSGKSTIIQAIHYAREIFVRHNVDPDRTESGGESVDLGGFQQFVHHDDSRDDSKVIRLRLFLELKGLPGYEDDIVSASVDDEAYAEIDSALNRCNLGWVEISVKWSAALSQPQVVHYGVGLGHEQKPIATIFKVDAMDERAKQLRELLLAGLRDDEIGKLAFIMLNWKHPMLADGGELAALRGLSQRTVEGLLSDDPVDPFSDESPPLLTIIPSPVHQPGEAHTVFRWRPAISALPAWAKRLSLPRREGAETSACVAAEWAMTRIIVGPGEQLRNELQQFRYLGPLRKLPPRNYTPPRFPEESRWPEGLAAWDALYGADAGMTEPANESPAKEPMVAETAEKQWDDARAPKDGKADTLSIQEVNDWFDDRLKAGYAVHLKSCTEVDTQTVPDPNADSKELKRFVDELRNRAPKKQVVLVPDGQSIEVQPLDVGTGVSQLLPVVVLALHAWRSLVAIEQPELHLHPKLQAELGDLLIESALSGRQNTMLIETHSEHLILRLMRRMRDRVRGKHGAAPPVNPEDVAVLFVESTPNGSAVRQLRLAPDGSLLDPWPGGFFEESFSEIFG
jgi:hypothetical protein